MGLFSSLIGQFLSDSDHSDSPNQGSEEADTSAQGSNDAESQDVGFRVAWKQYGLPETTGVEEPPPVNAPLVKFDRSEVILKSNHLDSPYKIEYTDIAYTRERQIFYRALDLDGLTESTRETIKKGTSDIVTNSVYKEQGLEIITERDSHIFIYNGNEDSSSYPSVPEGVSDPIQKKVSDQSRDRLKYEYCLVEPFDKAAGQLKVEGWTDGSSKIDADVNAHSESKGKSRGIEIGLFTRSKTASEASIDGDISGKITDNTYTTDVKMFKIYEENLIIDSEIKLDLYYSEIDNIFEHQDGVIIEVGSTTFRIEDVSNSDQISEAVAFVKEQMNTLAVDEDALEGEQDSVGSAEKLRDLNELHDDGILTDEEFEAKKEDLLNDF